MGEDKPTSQYLMPIFQILHRVRYLGEKDAESTSQIQLRSDKELNGGKQMTDVWRMPAIGRWEKTCGKHPTQKPLRLLVRMILASTNQGDWILDPFSGSSTTGIAANLCGRRFVGLEQEEEFCKLSKERREEIENLNGQNIFVEHIEDLHFLDSSYMVNEIPYGDEIPFY